MDFKGKAFIVTGASGGIGSEVAKVLVGAGALVVGCDLKRPSLVRRPNYRHVLGDVCNPATMRDCLKATDGNKLSGVVLCAAKGPFDKDPVSTIGTNYLAVIQCIGLVSRSLKEWGSVVTIGSIAGLRMREKEKAKWAWLLKIGKRREWKQKLNSLSSALPNSEAYKISKWALMESLPRLTKDLVRSKVRLNCLVLGPTKTGMSRTLWHDKPRAWKKYVSEIPFGVENSPKDVAQLAVVLLADFSKMVDGSFISVEGGWRLFHNNANRSSPRKFN